MAAFKERKVVAGVYALTCQPTGAVWIGETANLEGILNRQMFSLRIGSHPVATLQGAYRAHGEAAFAFEVLESLEDEEIPAIRAKWLRDRVAHWRAERGAAVV
ncbi:GIY-YIG nuclease family protein [Oryzibacter oryziterrae]|uniref:GIY-YIG nuclease family protein n=1 Tax=Oryzibacter oryziterrae TaxID=2766474 RepID=UPI001F23EA4F|nr:GIY-YIG nuclease family protein [Oryzibacter oryziterrae]